MSIQRPYQRTTKIIERSEINSWETVTLANDSSVTAELRGKTLKISPAFGKVGKERNHHKFEVEIEGEGTTNLFIGQAPRKEHIDRVYNTYYYTQDFKNISNGFIKEVPALYGNRNFNWYLVEDKPDAKITRIVHTYHQCPDEWNTSWMQEGMFEYKFLGGRMKYALSYPAGYNSNNTIEYPLVVSVGGSGELGDDGRVRVQTNPSSIITRYHDFFVNFPAFHLTVQIPFPRDFTEEINTTPSQWPYHDGWLKYYVEDGYGVIGTKEIINKLINNPDNHINVNKIYLTGFSGGGLFCYESLKGLRDIFAAIVPIAAWPIGNAYQDVENSQYWDSPPGGKPDSMKERLIKEMKRGRHIPTIVAAGDRDNMKHGTRAFKKIADQLHMNCKLDILPNANHGGSPKRFWAKREHLEWMFSQTKRNLIPPDPYPNARYSSPKYYADFNQDGIVNQEDVNIFAKEFKNTGSELKADANLDGKTDEFDLSILASQYEPENPTFEIALEQANNPTQPERKPFTPPRRSFLPPRNIRTGEIIIGANNIMENTEYEQTELKLTADDQGYYHLMEVDESGEKEISKHLQEREAVEKATNLKVNNPQKEYYYEHRYKVSVNLD